MGKHRRIQRIVLVYCTACWGTGRAGGGKCEKCDGTGKIETIVNEIVSDDEQVKTS